MAPPANGATVAPSPTAPAPAAPGVPALAPAPPGQAAQQPTAAGAQAPDQPWVQWPNAWVSKGSAELIVLDKVEGMRRPLTLAVGQSAVVGSLSVMVKACLVRPPTQPADAAAFLVITDSHKDESGFKGWTLANEPWLSELQNPEYDVWVQGCSG